MPTLEEVPPNVAELTENVDKIGLAEESGRRAGSDDGSDDEFHDACDRVSDAGEPEGKDEEFTDAELLVSKSVSWVYIQTHINALIFTGVNIEG